MLYYSTCLFSNLQTLNIPYSQRVKEGQTLIEYHEDDVQDSIYEAVLKQAYKMFRVRNLQLHLPHLCSYFIVVSDFYILYCIYFTYFVIVVQWFVGDNCERIRN